MKIAPVLTNMVNFKMKMVNNPIKVDSRIKKENEWRSVMLSHPVYDKPVLVRYIVIPSEEKDFGTFLSFNHSKYEKGYVVALYTPQGIWVTYSPYISSSQAFNLSKSAFGTRIVITDWKEIE